jgi:hypothetical protein
MERISKESVVAKSRYYPDIFLEGLRNATKIFCQDGWNFVLKGLTLSSK